jgi:hypothetical protein
MSKNKKNALLIEFIMSWKCEEIARNGRKRQNIIY